MSGHQAVGVFELGGLTGVGRGRNKDLRVLFLSGSDASAVGDAFFAVDALPYFPVDFTLDVPGDVEPTHCDLGFGCSLLATWRGL